MTAKVNDVIQIDPAQQNSFFPGCFAIVTEVRPLGVLCFVSVPRSMTEMPGRAYVRVRNGDYEVIGSAQWAPEAEPDAGPETQQEFRAEERPSNENP